MHLLVVTNLYPPQELGGYGRCISDFSWGLIQRGHEVQVLCADAPYLYDSVDLGPSGENVCRRLKLKGSFESGVTLFQELSLCQSIDFDNTKELSLLLHRYCFDAVILGNIDLLGIEIFPVLLSHNIPVMHHIGFISPPYQSVDYPDNSNYLLVSASESVRANLIHFDYPIKNSPVVYPGVRTDLFSLNQHSISPSLRIASIAINSGFPLGHPSNPIKLGFAGLIMSSKGLHTLVEAIIILQERGLSIQANFAGSDFQSSYRRHLESLLHHAQMTQQVSFLGNLTRDQLIRFWSLHHIGVFPSIYPEAFGISAAEIMASGLALVSSAVGGSAELFVDRVSGYRFQAGDPYSLSDVIMNLVNNPSLLYNAAYSGRQRVINHFSVFRSSEIIEQILTNTFSQS